jgi:hypothetical protein
MWFYNQSDFETALNKKTAKNNKVCHPVRKELPIHHPIAYSVIDAIERLQLCIFAVSLLIQTTVIFYLPYI